MKLVRRILVGVVRVVVMITIILAGIYFAAPMALSFYAARKAPDIVRVVPTDLKDHSISQAPSTKLSYLGHDFEVPWTDLDDSKTILYPKDKPEKTRVVLTFHSGLRIMVTSIPPKEFAAEFATDFKVPPQKFDAFFGNGKGASDYDFVNNIYEFSPANMHHWSLSQAVQSRDLTRLIIKSMVLVKEAETGIFRMRNLDYQGFQQAIRTSAKTEFS